MEEMEITTKAFEVMEKRVKPSGNSGRIYVPKNWIGKRVKILLVEPITEKSKLK